MRTTTTLTVLLSFFTIALIQGRANAQWVAGNYTVVEGTLYVNLLPEGDTEARGGWASTTEPDTGAYTMHSTGQAICGATYERRFTWNGGGQAGELRLREEARLDGNASSNGVAKSRAGNNFPEQVAPPSYSERPGTNITIPAGGPTIVIWQVALKSESYYYIADSITEASCSLRP